ncbi:hypothetical protein Tco_0400636 [Tanacetum coccineum]
MVYKVEKAFSWFYTKLLEHGMGTLSTYSAGSMDSTEIGTNKHKRVQIVFSGRAYFLMGFTSQAERQPLLLWKPPKALTKMEMVSGQLGQEIHNMRLSTLMVQGEVNGVLCVESNKVLFGLSWKVYNWEWIQWLVSKAPRHHGVLLLRTRLRECFEQPIETLFEEEKEGCSSCGDPQTKEKNQGIQKTKEVKHLITKKEEIQTVHTLFMDGTPMEINMLVEKKYPLIKELLEKMLNLQLEAKEESTMAFELIKFIKSMLEE